MTMSPEIQELKTLLKDTISPLVEVVTQQSAQIELLKQQLGNAQNLTCLKLKEAAPLLQYPSADTLRLAIDRGEFKMGQEIYRRGDSAVAPYLVNVSAIRLRWQRESETGGFR